jgi:hypothetical protein
MEKKIHFKVWMLERYEMEHVNNKVSQFLSKHKGVVS